MPTEVIVPKVASLKKYGITQEEWLKMAEEQGGVCPICKKLPENRRLCTDHEHVRGYKKLPIKNKSIYVRGACCLRCNLRFLPAHLTIEKAKNVVIYLEAYEKRKQEHLAKTMPSSVLPDPIAEKEDK